MGVRTGTHSWHVLWHDIRSTNCFDAGRWSAQQGSLDYVFSHFCGIWCTSLVCLIVYKIKNGGEAYHPLNIVIPPMVSGIAWGIAQVAWFKANAALSYCIAFPIICTCPGYLSVFWGITIFGELKGKRARLLTLAAFCFQVPGVILVALSRG